MKLLVDMNLSPRWTGMLAGFGFEELVNAWRDECAGLGDHGLRQNEQLRGG